MLIQLNVILFASLFVALFTMPVAAQNKSVAVRKQPVEAERIPRFALDWEPDPNYPSETVIGYRNGRQAVVALKGGKRIRRRLSAAR